MIFSVQAVMAVKHGGRVNPNAEDIDRLTDSIQEQLLHLEDIADPDLTTSLASGEVRLSVQVSADSAIEAMKAADDAIRTAIHAAGIATPGWGPESLHEVQPFDWHITQTDPLPA
jgi:hypothetical protein